MCWQVLLSWAFWLVVLFPPRRTTFGLDLVSGVIPLAWLLLHPIRIREYGWKRALDFKGGAPLAGSASSSMMCHLYRFSDSLSFHCPG